jgi:hypothetical protein
MKHPTTGLPWVDGLFIGLTDAQVFALHERIDADPQGFADSVVRILIARYPRLTLPWEED